MCEVKLDNAFFNDQENYNQILKLFSFLKVHRNHLCCPSIDEYWGNVEARLQE